MAYTTYTQQLHGLRLMSHLLFFHGLSRESELQGPEQVVERLGRVTRFCGQHFANINFIIILYVYICV